MNLDELNYRQVQDEAKKRGLKYTGKKVDILNSIKEYDMKDRDTPIAQSENPDRVAALESKFERVEAMLAQIANAQKGTTNEVPSTHTQSNAAQPVEEIEDMEEIVEAAPVNTGMLLDEYLRSKGMSFKELETLIYNYQSANRMGPGGDERIETLDDIDAKVKDGVEGAKQIVDAGKTTVKVKDIYIVDALQKEFGWTVMDNHGGVHTLTA